MTVLGREGIPKAELLKRLRISESTVDAQVGSLVDDNKLSRLLVSFFFHAGRPEHGCEFSHKSFREYLFAEQIVEELKRFGSEVVRLQEREPYWQDFESTDPRRDFAHRMTKLLGPQWITREVGNYVTELIDWEVLRSIGSAALPSVRDGSPTTALPLGQWLLLRDTLADLWDWWGEGVHYARNLLRGPTRH